MKKRYKKAPFIGEGVKFEGKLKFTETLRINGHFEGDILEGSKLFIGKNAVIKGNIHVSSLVLEGEIHGNILADDRVVVSSSGKVFGSIQAPAATIDEKSVLVGNCRVNKSNGSTKINDGCRAGDVQTTDKGSNEADMKSAELELSPSDIDETPAHPHKD